MLRRRPRRETAPTPPTVALCGAGMIAGAHAAAATINGYPLVGVASRSATRAASQAAQWKTRALGYADLPAGADIVVVATPPHRHCADALTMLAGGAAVLVEKPLCRTLAEADALVAASEVGGNVIAYGENLLATAVLSAMIRHVGRLGALTHLEARSLQGLPTWGAFTTDDWGGGALFDLGVHPLAIVMVLAAAAGQGRAVAVRGALAGADGHGSDEWGEVYLRFAGGATARVEASWRHGPAPMWDAQVASATGVLRAELMPEISLELNGDQVEIARPHRGQVPPQLDPIVDYGYAAQLSLLAEARATAEEPACNVRFGRDVLEVVCAAYASAACGAGRATDADEISLPWSGRRDLTPLQLWRGTGAS